MLNKVPEVTLYFWIIKVLCTTVGETAADFLNDNLGLGLTKTTFVTGAVLVVALVFQFRVRRYVPGIYWLAVVLISVVGTLITDNLTDNFGVSLVTTTVVFSFVLAAVFAAWYASERTLSIHTIVTTRREAFYWLTVLFTFALGTAAGDLTAERLAVGYWKSALLFAALIGIVYVLHLKARPERDPRLLDRLHPDAPARRLDRRLPLAAAGRRRPRPRDDGHERHLPAHDPGRGRLPVGDQGRPDRGGGRRRSSSQTGRRRVGPRRHEQAGGDAGPRRGCASAGRNRAGRVPRARPESQPPGLRPRRARTRDEAAEVVAAGLPALEQAAGSAIDVRVAHSPNAFDDIMAALDTGDYDEIILETPPSHVSHWLHVDLSQRIAHLGYPLLTVAASH